MAPTSERELVRLLGRTLATGSPEVVVGIGDDAAVLSPSPEPTVLSVDASIEGVHFERRFAPLPVLAGRALTAAVSDLAAMGARPRAALVSLVLPEASLELVGALAEGLAEAGRRWSCPIVGGNLARGPGLSLHTTVVGGLVGRALGRAGARAGDDVWVSGPVGGAHLGLTALLAGRSDAELAPFVERWRRPAARLDLTSTLLRWASAAMDLSDGLAADAPRLAEASGASLAIELERLPRDPGLDAAAKSLGLDPLECAFRGGEDYELLFTAPAAAREDLSKLASRIGHVAAGSGIVTTRGGTRVVLAGGFDHFDR